MKKLARFALSAIFATAAQAAPALGPPPATATVPVADTYFGTSVADPYRWLEDTTDPKVEAWNSTQNSHARAYLDALPARKVLHRKITALVTATSPAFYALTLGGDRIFAIYNDPKFQQPMLVTLGLDAEPAARKVVLDPNVLDPKGQTSIDWFVPSPDGALVAISLSQRGSEDGTLHVYDVARGKPTGEIIPRVQYPTGGGSLAWANNKSFWYTRYPGEERPEADRHFYMQVYLHKLGTDWKSDPLILGTADGLPRISEVFLDNRFAPGEVLASVQKGDGGEWQHWRIAGDGKKQRVADFPDRIVTATLGPDRALYLVSRQQAPNGKVLKLVPGATLDRAQVLVPETEAAVLIDGFQHTLQLTGTRLLVPYIAGGPGEIRVFDLSGTPQPRLPLPEISSFSGTLPLPNGDILIGVSSYLRPYRYVRIRGDKGALAETRLAIESPIRYDDAEVVREFAVSKDGTKVPVSIIRRKGMVLDGRAPAMLIGYGGYGVSQEPSFAGASVRLWLDAGGIYAEANTRGGGEYGARWHDAGRLTWKQNVFDDFAAVAEHLVARKYTDSSRLALRGGSNGGLLMGAIITQRPQLARAVVSAVGIYDMLRVELDPNGEFNTTEFGTVKDQAQFKALHAYSPYHRVVKGAKYPAVLMLTGAHDGRVNPMHSRKFAAALQATSGSGLPVLLRLSSTSGHGIGSSLQERIDQAADALAFLFDQLGVPAPMP